MPSGAYIRKTEMPLVVRQKISRTMRGKPMPANCLKVLRENHPRGMLGKIPWNKGKKMSKEFCEKISAVQMGKPRPNQRGEKSFLWRGGVTSLRGKIWNSLEFKTWRKDIFERDNYTCQMCGIKSKKGLGKTVRLEADHYPKPFVLFIRQITSMELDKNMWFERAINHKPLWEASGRTLCSPCHNTTKKGRVTLSRALKDEEFNTHT